MVVFMKRRQLAAAALGVLAALTLLFVIPGCQRDSGGFDQCATILPMPDLFAYLLTGVFRLQVVESEEYADSAESRRTTTITLRGSRGMITDADAVILARDADIYNVTFYRDASQNSAAQYRELTQSIVETALDRCVDEHVRDWNSVKTRVREALSSYVYRRTKRSPMILPILMEV